VFNTQLKNEQLFFSFESRYAPFGELVHDELKPIDLVLLIGDNRRFIRPLEIKLTTLPDNSTAELDDCRYGTELVVRNPTTRYMALSFAESCKDSRNEMKSIFQPSCLKIRDWSNLEEMKRVLPKVLESLKLFLSTFRHKQRPLLMQPIWKTIGKSSQLADNCLDIFVWSDFALTELFMGSACNALKGDKITRQQRSALRLARFLYEFATQGKVYQQPIYDGMTFDTLNDKEFSVSGMKTHPLMSCDRLTKPLITKNVIKEIVLGGGQNFLSPERRFDAIIHFSHDLFD